MAQIGHIYANGEGVPQNNKTALDWFLQSIEGKTPDPSGLFGVGYMYLHGYGVEQNTTEAVDWLKGAAKRHNAEALYHLGIIRLEEAYRTPEETQEAVQNIQDAAAVRLFFPFRSLVPNCLPTISVYLICDHQPWLNSPRYWWHVLIFFGVDRLRERQYGHACRQNIPQLCTRSQCITFDTLAPHRGAWPRCSSCTAWRTEGLQHSILSKPALRGRRTMYSTLFGTFWAPAKRALRRT